MLLQAPCFRRLRSSLSPGSQQSEESILLLGIGGGYDVFCAVPIYIELLKSGYDASQIHLANLSFTKKLGEKAKRYRAAGSSSGRASFNEPQGVHDCTYDRFPAPNTDSSTSAGPASAAAAGSHDDPFDEAKGFPENYFPELHLSRWLVKNDLGSPHSIALDLEYFSQQPVATLSQALHELCTELKVTRLVLIDAGVDSLLRGDEAGLGTYSEDMMSLVAASACTSVAQKILVCIGLGSEGGISEIDFMRNCAAIQRAGGYEGCVSWTESVPSVEFYCRAVDESVPVNTTINCQIVHSIRGRFGNDCPPPAKKRGVMNQDVFLNPLMGVSFVFDFDAVMREKRPWFVQAVESATSQLDIHDRVMAERKRLSLEDSHGKYSGPFPYFQMTRTHNKLMDDSPDWALRTEPLQEH